MEKCLRNLIFTKRKNNTKIFSGFAIFNKTFSVERLQVEFVKSPAEHDTKANATLIATLSDGIRTWISQFTVIQRNDGKKLLFFFPGKAIDSIQRKENTSLFR